MPRRRCISQLAVGPRGHVEGGGARAGWWHAFTRVDGPVSCVRAVQDGARATAVVGVQPMEPLVGAVGAVDCGHARVGTQRRPRPIED